MYNPTKGLSAVDKPLIQLNRFGHMEKSIGIILITPKPHPYIQSCVQNAYDMDLSSILMGFFLFLSSIIDRTISLHLHILP